MLFCAVLCCRAAVLPPDTAVAEAPVISFLCRWHTATAAATPCPRPPPHRHPSTYTHAHACEQASPADPDSFPFVVLGNKVDVEGGTARQVSEKKAKQVRGGRGGGGRRGQQG